MAVISSIAAITAANAAIIAANSSGTLSGTFIAVDVIILKIFFVVAVIGMIFGGYKAYDEYRDLVDTILGALLGFIFAPALTAFIVGVCYGVYWLFI